MFPASAARTAFVAAAIAVASLAGASAQTTGPDTTTHYRQAKVDGVEIFYREAGKPSAPAVLLLHGFPTSSRYYRNLIPVLAKDYHVIAPDYPAFGHSPALDRAQFSYTFANLAKLVDGLVTQLGVSRYALYIQDYGAPVGLRLALLHPERVSALVVQNGNAYEEGLQSFWDPVKAYWASPTQANRNALRPVLSLQSTRAQYTEGVSDPSRLDPDSWLMDQALLDRPGIDEIQLDLFKDYGTNVPLYPQFQAFFRTHRPPTLIVWGKNDFIFPAAGATPYLRDLPQAELHLLDSGHFALEDKGAEIATLMKAFLDRTLRKQ